LCGFYYNIRKHGKQIFPLIWISISGCLNVSTLFFETSFNGPLGYVLDRGHVTGIMDLSGDFQIDTHAYGTIRKPCGIVAAEDRNDRTLVVVLVDHERKA
jgi:hypothetical protein